jgi:hypothetical protein
VSPVSVRRSRFAVDPCLGCAVFPSQVALVAVKSTRRVLSSSFAFLQSLAQRTLAGRPQSTGSSHGLLLPSAHQGPEVHSTRAFQVPLRSAFRVWLPSWRFTPSEPVPALFRTGSAPGICPSEPSPLSRYPARFRADEPTCRFPRQFTNRTRRWAGPTRRSSWALTLSRVPHDQANC